MTGRREFLRKSGIAAGSALIVWRSPFLFQAKSAGGDARIEILLGEPLGTIAPEIYGHFCEHLGGLVYDGLWVGEGSKIPNLNGIRKELVDEMKKIHPAVVRYPGGCFADSYDWRDGIGPANKRPRRTNFWAGAESANAPTNHKYEPNQFGTNEFARFCKLLGAKPYLAANVRSLSAEQFYQWVEYCNSPAGSTTLADERAAAGSSDPYGVCFWGVGNESWGCGGNFTPQEYAVEFRRWTEWVPSYGQELSFIGSGPNVDDWEWTRGFLEELVKKGKGRLRSVWGMALHHYAWNLSRGKTNDWEVGKGDALKFDTVDWYELLREGERMEGLINGHWQIMGEIDTEHRVKLVVDEWGPWYRPGGEMTPGNLLEQTPTLRDAIFSGMTLDIFNRHPEKVAMANCAQLMNCLNSLYLAHENNFCVTPVGHVFGMYAAHQGGEGLRTIFSAPQISYDRDGNKAFFWGLKGAASLRDKKLVLTVVNPDVSAPRETEIAWRGGGRMKSGRVSTLTHTDMHAHNSFDHPDVVKPVEVAFAGIGGGGLEVRHTFPAASVTRLELELE
jgi:alpha-L-arabinofuranosidase